MKLGSENYSENKHISEIYHDVLSSIFQIAVSVFFDNSNSIQDKTNVTEQKIKQDSVNRKAPVTTFMV